MFDSVEELSAKLAATGYFIDPVMTMDIFLAGKLRKPLILEGPAGSGKTQLALAVAQAANTHIERLQCYEGLTDKQAIGEFDQGLQRLYMEFCKGQGLEAIEAVGEQPESLPHPSLLVSPEDETFEGYPREEGPNTFATRADLASKPGTDKSKMIMLGGGLLVAVVFFVFTAIVGRSPATKKPEPKSQQAIQQAPSHTKGSVTPLMDAVRRPSADNADGQLGPGDIRHTQTTRQ